MSASVNPGVQPMVTPSSGGQAQPSPASGGTGTNIKSAEQSEFCKALYIFFELSVKMFKIN